MCTSNFLVCAYLTQSVHVNSLEGTLLTCDEIWCLFFEKACLRIFNFRSQDIKQLSIVKSSEEVREIPLIVNKQISLLSALNNPTPPQSSNTGLVDEASSAGALAQSRTCSGAVHQGAHRSNPGPTALSSKFPTGLPLRTPKSVQAGNNSIDTDGLVDCLNRIGILDRGLQTMAKGVSNGKQHSSQMNNSSSFVDLERSFGSPAENKFSARKRTSSGMR